MPESRLLTGWGRTAPTRADVREVRGEADVTELVAEAIRRAGPRGVLARGLGRSYGDAAQNAGGVVLRLPPDGVVDVDPDAATVRVGAGVSLDDLLRRVLPHGLVPAVMPGTRQVSVGGAIAADVHGKSHHVDGSFTRHVDSVTFVDGRGEVRTAQAGGPDLAALAGGMGLTGVVTEATLRLRRVRGSWVRARHERVPDLDAMLDRFGRSTGSRGRATYSVAWIDLLARGRAMGRGIVSEGEHADDGGGRTPRAASVRVPLTPPSGLVNPMSMRAFNEAWFRHAPARPRERLEPLGAFFQPLDGLADWNRLYGRAGLVQYQLVVPIGAEEVVERVVRRFAETRAASFLAVLKRFGPGDSGLLSFPMAGWTLALDLPARPALARMLDELDELVVGAGGRIYLAKDSRATRATIEAAYPRLAEFRAARDRLDPDRVFTSDLARRLGL